MASSCLLFSSVISIAQNKTDYLNEALVAFEKANYYLAAQHIENYFSGASSNRASTSSPFALGRRGAKQKNSAEYKDEQLMILAATSYLQLNNHSKAADWFGKSLQQKIFADVKNYYWYAISLRAINKLDDALAMLNEFQSVYNKNDNWLAAAKREVANIAFIKSEFSKKKEGVHLSKIPTPDFSSAYALSRNADKFYFTSTKGTETNEAAVYNELNAATNLDGALNNIIPLPIAESNTHVGSASFANDGKTIYYTQWSVSNGTKVAAIYTSELINDKWTTPVIASNNINVKGYRSQDPFVTADNQFLFFASDRPGGLGKLDIWVVSLNEPNAKPINLGSQINTPEEEQSPFYNIRDQQLVFSSNGRVGMGGFDLYTAKGTINNWGEVNNPGAPINSIKDDLFYYSHSIENTWEQGWLSSDRDNDCCLQLYSLKQSIKPNYSFKGFIIDCETDRPVEDAFISIQNEKFRSSVVGDFEGKLQLPTSFQVQVSKKGYQEKTISGSIILTKEGNNIIQDLGFICLNKIEEPKPPVPTVTSFAFVYFDFDKALLNTEAKTSLDELANYLANNKEAKIKLTGHTDGKGDVNYNIKLAERRVKACMDYLIAKGVSEIQLDLQALGECCPVENESTEDGKDIPEARQKNRRVEIKLIQ